MNADKVLAALAGVPALKSLDDDVREYLAGVISDAGAAKDVATLEDSIGPFLESSGACSSDAEINKVCTTIHGALVTAGLVKAPRSASAGGKAAASVSATKALKQALGSKGALKSIAESAADKAALSKAGLLDGDDEDEEAFSDGEGAAAAGAGGGRRKLAAPVKLGAKTVDASTLDFLWGKESNAFANRNTDLEHDAGVERRAEKRADRAARKEESKARYEKSKAAESAAAEAAADAEEGRVTSGTVSYSLTEERKAGQDVHVSGFNMGYGGELLLEGADLHIAAGRRYGLVGRNGMGKSTLLRHMARGDVEGAGKERFPKNLRVLHVEQEVVGDAQTVLATVLAADVERGMLMAEEARIVAHITSGAAAGLGAGAAAAAGAADEEEEEASAAAGAGAGGKSSKGGKATSAASVSSAASTVTAGAGAPASVAAGDAESVLSAGVSAITVAGASEAGGSAAGVEAARPAADTLTLEAANARLVQIAARLEAIDAVSAESRASTILNGLGFSKEMQSWPTRSLSGGWRMRVGLAAALFMEPELLLLDEPTNHLDAKTLLWLVEYLVTYPKTLIIVSHDRWFLNAVCTDIIHLYNKLLTYWKGDYDTFERTRAEKQRCLVKSAEAADLRRAHIQAFIDKFRYNAKRAALVQSRIKALERMEVMEEVADDPKWRFEFPDPGALGVPVLQVDDVTFGYTPDRPLLKKANFSIDTSSRIAIVGPNGVGKSTLIKLLLNELEPQAGSVVRNSKLRIACFTQHHVNQLDLGATPVEYLQRMFPGSKPEAVRAHLGSFGLHGDLSLQRMSTLSGGQKSRVAFAVITWKKPHVVLLDEPTNHLDIETIDAVTVALGNYNGGVVVVSHDQHFVESVCDEIFVVGQPAGCVRKFKGEFKDYRRVAESEKAFQLGGDAEEDD